MRRLRHLLAGFSCLFMALLGTAQESTVRIGQSVPLTGPLAELGSEYRDGALAYFNSINERGGVHGRRIELQSLDDGYVVARTEENARKLIKESGVLAFFGMFGTANVGAVQPLIDDAGIPSIAPFTGSDELRKFNRNVFWVRASYGDETEKIVEQLTAVGIRRIAVFYQDDAFGKSGLAGVDSALKKRQIEVLAKAPYDKVSLDVQPAVKTIVAANPQAVVLISPYKATAAFVRELRKTGNPAQLFALSVVGYKALTTELGKEATGIAISQVMPYPGNASAPVVREFLKLPAALQPKAGLTYTTLEGYVAAKVMVEALRRAGPQPNREKLLAALESLRNYDAGGYQLNYTPTDHAGSRFAEVTIVGSSGRLMR